MACMLDRGTADIIFLNLSISQVLYKEMKINLVYLNLFSNIHFKNQIKDVDTLIRSTLEGNKQKFTSIIVDMQTQISNEEVMYIGRHHLKRKHINQKNIFY